MARSATIAAPAAPVPTGLRPLAALPVSPNWQARAQTAYRREVDEAGHSLRAALAARLLALTGRPVAPASLTADPAARIAVGVVDGVVFRLHGHELVVLRACAHCGVGQLASPAIESEADLGYALTDWQPLCPHCPSTDPDDWRLT